jgi:hypothetical protein
MKSCRSLLEIVRNGLFDSWVLVGSRRERLNSFLYFLLLGEGSSFMMQNLDWPITACSYPLSLTHGAGRPSTWWLQLWCKTVSIISFSCHLLSESSLKSSLRKAKWGTCLFCLPQIFLHSFFFCWQMTWKMTYKCVTPYSLQYLWLILFMSHWSSFSLFTGGGRVSMWRICSLHTYWVWTLSPVAYETLPSFSR